MAFAVQLEDVQAASARIRPLVRTTPVIENDAIDVRAGFRCFLKAENLQRTRSFKLRGATNFVRSLSEAELAQGIVAFSSGNHAQAVALAAKNAGAKATIVMPTDAPAVKLKGTQSHGAHIVFYDRMREDREAIARRVREERGGVLIPPFDHPWIIAGQGTCALELAEQVPDLDALVVCLGGGGLLAGSAVAIKGLSPNTRVFGVEPEAGDDAQQSFRAGKRISIPVPETIADGLRTTCVGEHNFPIIQAMVEDILTVSDEEITATARLLMQEAGILVEPSGAAALAAAIFGKLPSGLQRVGFTLSGGNAEASYAKSLCSESAL